MPNPVQGSLFEEDYLVRTLGSIAYVPEIALTELVANAWDAGATHVSIAIPAAAQGELRVDDDGTGMTEEQFRDRWMRLGYDRVKHQGRWVEFPPGREHKKRLAYGHNGVGRHGMLCFADRYTVESSRDGRGRRFDVATQAGEDPFVLLRVQETKRQTVHGTTLRAHVTRNLPNPDRVRQVLATRFLYDPEFSVDVNGASVPLTDLDGFIEKKLIKVDDISVEAICIDSETTAKTTQQNGVAFWVSNRLVGRPSWIVGSRAILDGRTRAARRLTIVLRTDDIVDEVLPDWSGFKDTEIIQRLFDAAADYAFDVTRRVMSERIEETRTAVLSENQGAIERLQPLGRIEVAEFAEDVARTYPTIAQETLSIAVQAMIRLEETRSGRALLSKLSQLPSDDVAGLNALLEKWTVRDALTVLDEIERRMNLVEALEKLVADDKVDETKTLHPLVTQARWLFGPEYESPQYVSNVSIRRAVEELFKERLPPESFVDPKKRPDLVFIADATISAYGIEELETGDHLVKLQRILLLELKRGKSTIGREQMRQASEYVEDLLASGHIGGGPRIQAFVVGHTIDSRIQTTHSVGTGSEMRARIDACTFDQLVRTANMRLFALRQQVADRYEGMEGTALATHLHSKQGHLFTGFK